jgi:hypothetical protein
MEEIIEKKKRGRKPLKKDDDKIYFGDREELAVRTFLVSQDMKEKDKIFREILDPALKKLIKGVLKMPAFQKIIGITIEELEENAYFHLIFQLEKYDPNRKDDEGKSPKAYSYYGTVIKNYILAQKQKLDKFINENSKKVDVDDLGDSIVSGSNTETDFNELRLTVIIELNKVLINNQKILNKNDIIVGHSLKHMIQNWHGLEFQTKNEFIRLLYTFCPNLKPSIVSRSLKKYKLIVYDMLAKKMT